MKTELDSWTDAAFWADIFDTVDRPSQKESSQKDRWNAKAHGFTHKLTRSGYIGQLIDRLALDPGESVLDMGCGPGTLAIPLARAGHHVTAVDFSDAMLAELRAAAALESPEVAARIDVFERAWEDDWGGIPQVDVAVASRSLITPDLADSLAKLESHAKSRIAITVVAGETPKCDLRVLRAIGRPAPEITLRRDTVAIVNYLFALGRLPRIDYLSYERAWHAATLDDMRRTVTDTVAPVTDAEARAIAAFVDEHASFDAETGEYALDYRQHNTWAYIEWNVPQL